MGRLFDRIVDGARRSVGEARGPVGTGNKSWPVPAPRPLAGWAAGATLEAQSADVRPAQALPGESPARPPGAFAADGTRNGPAQPHAPPGASTPPAAHGTIQAGGGGEPSGSRPAPAPDRSLAMAAAAAWAETRPAPGTAAPVESLRVPTLPREAREEALAGAQVEPGAPRTGAFLQASAGVEPAGREAASDSSPRIEGVARMAAELPRPWVPDDHPDPLGAYLQVAPRPAPHAPAPAPSPSLRSPAPPPPQLTIDHLDVHVIAEPPAPVGRGAPLPPASPRSGAWRTAARYYLGRLG